MPEISTLSVISAAIVGFTRPSRLKHVFHDLPHIVSRNVYYFVNLFSYIVFFHGKRFPLCFHDGVSMMVFPMDVFIHDAFIDDVFLFVTLFIHNV